MPAADYFKTIKEQPSMFKIITVGRISPVKNLEVLIEAARILAYERGRRDFVVEIYGDIGLTAQADYLKKLKAMVLHKDLDGFVHFKSSVPHSAVVPIYQSASVFVNLSSTGSLDKAVLEAMACEVLILTSNEAFAETLAPFSELCFLNTLNASALAEKLILLLALKPADRLALTANLRRIVLEHHSLEKLARTIINTFR
jgi:glycosyltransferase involved in cell wall biosynthesis